MGPTGWASKGERKTWALSPLYEDPVRRQLAASKPGSRFSPRTESAGALFWDFPASRTGEINVCCVSPRVYGTLLKQPGLTKMEVHITEMGRMATSVLFSPSHHGHVFF